MIERNKRVGELIAREVSLVLEFKVNDNRLKNVTIIGAEVSKDLKFCKVFFSVIGFEKEIKKALDGFKSSKNFIKREIFSKVLLRVVPEITFEYYNGLQKASEINRIINEHNLADRKSVLKD
ncbi:MAG: 30S ribosome-binding factor RbfA [Deltaproteobacteria bacterium]|nr:30S ribosome-binding factor RbfA [Deltaproteobacteria bacterium]